MPSTTTPRRGGGAAALPRGGMEVTALRKGSGVSLLGLHRPNQRGRAALPRVDLRLNTSAISSNSSIRWENLHADELRGEEFVSAARKFIQETQKLLQLGSARGNTIDKEFERLKQMEFDLKRKFGGARIDCFKDALRKPKNRYADVLPYIETLVSLNNRKGNEDFAAYINASTIWGTSFTGYGDLCNYIATQGPLECTAGDFWQMVIEQRANVIVMLTHFREGDQDKCCVYFPTEVGGVLTFRTFTVTTLDVQACDGYSVREIQVEDARQGTLSTVLHFWMDSWRDQDIPATDKFLSLVDHVQDCVSSTEVPVGYKSTIVVHCSAGIGRTGVFVAVDSLLRRIRSCVDTLSSHISNTVHTMREHRGGMVQNRDQYRFVYASLARKLVSLIEEEERFNSNFTDRSELNDLIEL